MNVYLVVIDTEDRFTILGIFTDQTIAELFVAAWRAKKGTRTHHIPQIRKHPLHADLPDEIPD